MRLKNDIDYKRFPEPRRGDWGRFTILVLSATGNSPAQMRRAVLVCGGRELARGRRIPKQHERPPGRGLLHENQALIEVENGRRISGFPYIYSIVKTYNGEEEGVGYTLVLDFLLRPNSSVIRV